MEDATASAPGTPGSARDPRARLLLSDGSEFPGRAFGSTRACAGEVVFTTGMVGYPESLTDPSYRGQILAFTYPLIGNYGVPPRSCLAGGVPEDFESARIQVEGVVVSTLSPDHSHWSAGGSLAEWLSEEGIPGIDGVDTRALTKRLRRQGTMPGRILIEGSGAGGGDAGEILEKVPFAEIGRKNLVREVSVPRPVLHGDGSPRVILVDCGVKAGIIRSLRRRGVSVLQVPWNHDLAAENGDGILVSNGPGDPKMAAETVERLRAALDDSRPLFGICLGNQLVGLAAGCDTYKLKFGHRSQNQPCVEEGTRRCTITSQNHGYAVDSDTLPDGWEVWFSNANDGTNEGIRHREKPFFTVQFHPEACPGPGDTGGLFDRFVEMLR